LFLEKDVSPLTGVSPLASVGPGVAQNIKAFAKSLTQAGYSRDKAHLLTIHRGCGVTGVGRDPKGADPQLRYCAG
jgi:hypothetical protein